MQSAQANIAQEKIRSGQALDLAFASSSACSLGFTRTAAFSICCGPGKGGVPIARFAIHRASYQRFVTTMLK